MCVCVCVCSVSYKTDKGSCVITNMLHFRHPKNLKLITQLAYIVTDADCDCGRYFNVFKTFSNISMTYPIVLISIMGLYSHQYGI